MKRESPKPPLLGRLLLRVCRLGERRDDVCADMLELFERRIESAGRREARRRFNADAFSVWWKPPVRTPWPRPRWSWVTDVPGDIQYGARVLRKQIGVVSMAVAGLAVAIGLTSAVFSLANAFNFKPLGVAAPERVVFPFRTIGQTRVQLAGWMAAHAATIQGSARTVALGISLESRVSVVEGAQSTATPRVPIRFVSDGFLDIFGARVHVGRLPDSADGTAEAPPVAVLNYEYWRAYFGSDPSIVGRDVTINGSVVTVIGVVARGFTGPFDVNRTPAAWLPLASAPTVDPLAGGYGGTFGTVDLVGSLRPDVSVEQAEAELTAMAIGVGAISARSDGTGPTGVAIRSGGNEFTLEDAALIGILLTIAGLVVVLAATNVANLMLANVAGRQAEVRTRLALGAGRGRVVRQFAAESIALGLVAGGLGLLLAQWFSALGARLFVLSNAIDLSLDWRVYTFVAGVSVFAGAVAGLTPAIQGTRATQWQSRRQRRSRSRLVAVQAAASVVLVLLTALFTRALVEVSSRELGFDPTRVAVLTAFDPLKTALVPESEFFDLALARLRAIPGVRAVALTNHAPYEGSFTPVPSTLNGEAYRLVHTKSTPAYFDVAGYRFLEGQPFTDDDVRTKAKVGVVTAGFARDWFPAGDALGSDLGVVRDYLRGIRIVGIVTNAAPHIGSPAYSTSEALFTPMHVPEAARIVVSTEGQAAQVLPALGDALSAIDAGRRVTTRVVVDGLADQMSGPRMLAILAGVIGSVSLVLAIVGMFGVTAFTVQAGRREIGIRLAIGATRAGVVVDVARQCLRPAVIGLIVGLVLAVIGGRVIAFALYAGVSPRDPLSFVSAAAMVVLASVAGIVIPARRAAAVDPVESLRAE